MTANSQGDHHFNPVDLKGIEGMEEGRAEGEGASSVSSTVDYYLILEISRNATPEEIKRAYRKQALRFHPDKVSQRLPESEASALHARFQSISQAHQVLSDPKRRQIYDKYGVRGLEMLNGMSQMAPFIDPDFLLAIHWVFIVGSGIVAILILFPAFVAAKTDGVVSWSWSSIFVPLYVLDGMAILHLIWSIGSSWRTLRKAPSLEAGTIDEGDERHQELQQTRAFLQLKCGSLFLLILFVAFQLSVMSNLDGGRMSWWSVFIPWFILEGLTAIALVARYYAKVMTGVTTWKAPSSDSASQTSGSGGGGEEIRPYSKFEVLILFLTDFQSFILRLSQVILFVAKISGDTDWSNTVSWWVVFLPSWLWIVPQLIFILQARRELIALKRSPTAGASELEQKQAMYKASVFGFVVTCVLFYSFMIMLTIRLSNGGPVPTTAVILIPLFVVLGLAFLCVGCCMPCAVMCTRIALEDELMRGGVEVSSTSFSSVDRLVTVERRIAAQQPMATFSPAP